MFFICPRQRRCFRPLIRQNESLPLLSLRGLTSLCHCEVLSLFVIASAYIPSRHCEAPPFLYSEAFPFSSLRGLPPSVTPKPSPRPSLRGTPCRSNLEVNYYAHISSTNPRQNKSSFPLVEKPPPFVIARHPVPKQSRILMYLSHDAYDPST